MRLAPLVVAFVGFSACVPAAQGGPGDPSRHPSARSDYEEEYQVLRERAVAHAEEQRERVERVGRRLLEAMPDPPKVQFVIVPNDPSLNAGASFGQVALTGGMMRFLESDDEMAVVLGHELAHITEGHVTKGAISGIALNVLAIVLETQAPGAGRLAGGVGQLFLNRFTQGQERAADGVGQGFAYAAGYDPRAAVEVQERLAVEAPQTLSAGYFDSHPSSAERAVNARRRAEELLAKGTPPGREEALASASRGDRRRPRAGSVSARSVAGGPDYEHEDEPASSRERRDSPRSSFRPEREPAAQPTSGLSEDCRRAETYAERAADAGSTSERQDLYRRALRYCPSLAEAHEGLARTLEDGGDRRGAEYEYRRAEELRGGVRDRDRSAER